MKTVKEILADYLKANGFDGLCHTETECGCGLDDLIGPCEGAQKDCQPAYRISDPDGEIWYSVAFDHRPTKEEVQEYWKKKRENNDEA